MPGKALGVEIGFRLNPGDGHGDIGAGHCARRKRRHRRRHAIIAKITEEMGPSHSFSAILMR
jgi:hypothetical protein